MEIVISYSTTKRQIDGPFSICGRGKDLALIASRITEALARDGEGFYGWVEVSERGPVLPNQAPVAWDDQAQAPEDAFASVRVKAGIGNSTKMVDILDAYSNGKIDAAYAMSAMRSLISARG